MLRKRNSKPATYHYFLGGRNDQIIRRSRYFVSHRFDVVRINGRVASLVQIVQAEIQVNGGVLALFAVRLELGEVLRRDRAESTAGQVGRAGRS